MVVEHSSSMLCYLAFKCTGVPHSSSLLKFWQKLRVLLKLSFGEVQTREPQVQKLNGNQFVSQGMKEALGLDCLKNGIGQPW